jgi:hypothetical protein
MLSSIESLPKDETLQHQGSKTHRDGHHHLQLSQANFTMQQNSISRPLINLEFSDEDLRLRLPKSARNATQASPLNEA